VDAISDVPDTDALRRARRIVLDAAIQAATTTPLPQFVRQLAKQHPNLFLSHAEDGNWRNVYYRGIRERGGREDVERAGNWERVEGAVVAWMVAWPLARLGWIQWDHVAAAIAPAPAPGELPPFEIIVQPNFEVLVIGEQPDAGVLWRMARFTTPALDSGVRRYLIERAPFTEALGRGEDAAALVATLESLSRTPLPQNVRFSLSDWGALSARIKIWPDALLIEAEGVENLDTLLPEKLRHDLDAAAIGPHWVANSPGLARLRELLPARRTLIDYSRRLPPVLAPDQGSMLKAPPENLHLRARQVLDLLCRPTVGERFELDAAKVAAAAHRLGSETVLRVLREACAEALTPTVELSLRAWSGEFPPPFIGSAELLLADHPAQAAALEVLPELQPLIARRVAAGVYLLKPGCAGKVRELLTALGIPHGGEQP
jgi:hypothetical protein